MSVLIDREEVVTSTEPIETRVTDGVEVPVYAAAACGGGTLTTVTAVHGSMPARLPGGRHG